MCSRWFVGYLKGTYGDVMGDCIWSLDIGGLMKVCSGISDKVCIYLEIDLRGYYSESDVECKGMMYYG